MSWLAASPVAGLAALWVLAPGLAGSYAAGLRGVTAWGVAPVVSTGAVALGAVVAGGLGIRWSPAVALAAALIVATVLLGTRRLLRHTTSHRERAAASDGWKHPAAAAVGMMGAIALAAVTVVRGMSRPDAISHTYDAVFHYNAVAEVLASGNASSLAVGTLSNPTVPDAFYPAAWHDLVSLVVLTSGASVPLASNALAFVIGAVVWPLSCLVLVRQVIGRSAGISLVTPVVAVGFIAFPWSLMTYGVLWPNLLGLALVPVVLAAVATLCGLAREGTWTRRQALVVMAVAAPALALAHPATIFSIAVVSAPPVGWWLAAWLRVAVRHGRWPVAVSVTAGLATLAAAILYLVIDFPLLASVRSFDWPAFETPAQAVGEVVMNATNGKDAAWALSLVVVAGLVAAARRPDARWLVVSHLVSGMLFVLAAALDTPVSKALTGLWYGDSFRLAAMLPVTGVPLAVLGLLALGGWVGSLAQRVLRGGRDVRPGLASAAAALVLVLVSSGMYVRDHAEFLATTYHPGTLDASLVTPQQQEFLTRVGPLVPRDAVVAQNPWNGSALMMALTGREVLLPHLDGTWTADQLLLAQHLTDAATDPAVCAAAARLRVGYLLVGPVRFWPDDHRTRRYPGLNDPGPAPGFELVAAQPGGFRLYRLTACDPTAAAS